jgi:hypothetical protein
MNLEEEEEELLPRNCWRKVEISSGSVAGDRAGPYRSAIYILIKILKNRMKKEKAKSREWILF